MMTSLQKLCLIVIAEHFEKFHFAFEDSNSCIPKRSFEFLQRQYSSELALQLYETQWTLKEKFLEFLMNEHLNFIHNRWFRESRYTKKCLNDIFCHLPNLTRVSWSGFYWDDVNDEIIENLAKYCPKLVEINVSQSSVTDDGIKYLCKKENGEFPCPALKKIHIGSKNLTDEGLRYIILNLPLLEEIGEGSIFKILYNLHKDDLPNLDNVRTYNITHLEFCRFSFPLNYRAPYYTDMLKICLKVCPRLKSVRCVISDKEQLKLLNNTSFQDLELHVLNTGIKIDINNFLKNNGCNLVSLKVFNCIMSVNNLTTGCPKLKHLYLTNCTISGDFNDQKSEFHYLTECILIDIRFDITSNEGMSLFLSCSPKLETLEFHYCRFAPKMETGNIIWSQCNLKSICISTSDLHMEIVKDIVSNCSVLNILKLRYFDYNDNECDELCELVSRLHNKPKIDFFTDD